MNQISRNPNTVFKSQFARAKTDQEGREQTIGSCAARRHAWRAPCRDAEAAGILSHWEADLVASEGRPLLTVRKTTLASLLHERRRDCDLTSTYTRTQWAAERNKTRSRYPTGQ